MRFLPGLLGIPSGVKNAAGLGFKEGLLGPMGWMKTSPAAWIGRALGGLFGGGPTEEERQVQMERFLTNLKDRNEEVETKVTQKFEDLDYKLDKILNNGIEFGDNVKGGWIEVETNGDEQEVQHGLGYTPRGFLVVAKDGSGDVYADRMIEWNKETLFLKSSAPSLTVRLFVL